MVKMQPLSNPGQAYYTEDPSWFWTTFEFNDNPGVARARDALITQCSPLPEEQVTAIPETGGLTSLGFDAYAPNGTQIRFTQDGAGETPVILGHTNMEDFAGSPNTAQPRYWNRFEASCHSCHATASYNPDTQAFFPFSVPTLSEAHGCRRGERDRVSTSGERSVLTSFVTSAARDRRPGTALDTSYSCRLSCVAQDAPAQVALTP